MHKSLLSDSWDESIGPSQTKGLGFRSASPGGRRERENAQRASANHRGGATIKGGGRKQQNSVHNLRQWLRQEESAVESQVYSNDLVQYREVEGFTFFLKAPREQRLKNYAERL